MWEQLIGETPGWGCMLTEVHQVQTSRMATLGWEDWVQVWVTAGRLAWTAVRIPRMASSDKTV